MSPRRTRPYQKRLDELHLYLVKLVALRGGPVSPSNVLIGRLFGKTEQTGSNMIRDLTEDGLILCRYSYRINDKGLLCTDRTIFLATRSDSTPPRAVQRGPQIPSEIYG